MSRVFSSHWLNAATLFGWDNATPTRSSGTSWLDGLRGVASLQVFFFHFFGRYTLWGRSYGSTPEDKYIHQLPIFRSIWGAGSSAVCVFFVISGFAITVKSLTLMRKRRYDDLYKGLCSSLTRRGFRLYLPIIVLAVPMLFVIRWVNMVRDGYVFDREVKDTLWHQFVHLANATDDHLNPFMYPDYNPVNNRYAYVPPSWTIPLEYQGSICTYIMVLIVSRIEIFHIRCSVITGMAIYSLHRGSWWNSNFITGMLLADCILEQQSRAGSLKTRTDKAPGKLRTAFWILLFSIGWYLAGMPPKREFFDFDPKPKPGYETLYKWYPSHTLVRIADETRWYWYWSGTFTVVSISQLSYLRGLLDTRFCQWLGKLSFALYLTHAAFISALSTPLENIAKTVTAHRGFICLFEFVVTVPLAFATAALAEKYIDRPSVRFAKRVEQWLWRERSQGAEELPMVVVNRENGEGEGEGEFALVDRMS